VVAVPGGGRSVNIGNGYGPSSIDGAHLRAGDRGRRFGSNAFQAVIGLVGLILWFVYA